jgi:hypothetical protein
MTPTPSFPVPDVFYRIQSLDLYSDLYLELYGVDEEKLVLRPLRDDSLEQQVSGTMYH